MSFCFLFDLASSNQQRQAHRAIRHSWTSFKSFSNQTVSYIRFVFIQYSFNSNQQMVSFCFLLYLASSNHQMQADSTICHSWTSLKLKLNQRVSYIRFVFIQYLFNSNKQSVSFCFFLTVPHQISRVRHIKPFVTAELHSNRFQIK